jgi:hypothetical protein
MLREALNGQESHRIERDKEVQASRPSSFLQRGCWQKIGKGFRASKLERVGWGKGGGRGNDTKSSGSLI